MDAINTLYQSVPPFVWAFLFGTPFIVGFVNVCKKLFGVNSTLVIHSLTATTGFLLTVLPELLAHNPKPVLFNAAVTSAFFTAANFLYAASKKLQPFFSAVEQYEQRKATTAASTLSVSSATGVSSSPIPAVVSIPVSDGTEFQG